jgi:carboxypeptidase Taq
MGPPLPANPARRLLGGTEMCYNVQTYARPRGGIYQDMDKFAELKTRLAEINDLQTAGAVLRWDQQTYMPPGGAGTRAMQLTTLARIAHERFVRDEIGQLLTDLEAEFADLEYDSFEASLVRVTRREYDRERRLPDELVAELAKARALGHAAWEKARAASDFGAFLPYLETIVDLTIQKAEALGYQDRRYDALLDYYEPGMTTTRVEALFDEMKVGLAPLVQAIAERKGTVDDSILAQDFDVSKQWAFGIEVIERIGFHLERGRQDKAVHPFTSGFSPDDVRLTTRVSRDQVKSALFATIHEMGHGTYEQGYDRALDRTPLSGPSSLGIHESQSRMWENVVGRSRGFWTFWLPRLKEYFPAQLNGVDVDAFYRAINRVEPSPIRVEADEVTYNLHIFLRFEIESLMLEGKVRIADLPELWNAGMEEYLGLRPDNDANGVLQDVHWSGGMMGYFPTYSLGNLLAALFFEQAVSEEPGIPAQIERGDYSALLAWMRDKIHRHGAKYTSSELVERVTGGPIRARPFLAYIRKKYTELYGL